jgi:hypothetical protein
MPSVRIADSEIVVQKQCLDMIAKLFPHTRVAAVPNGQKRTRWQQQQAKREGMSAGFPDLIIVSDQQIMSTPFKPVSAFVEIKAKAPMTEEQKDWLMFLTGRDSSQPLRAIRGIAMVVARQATGRPMKAIGKAFGGRDHSTVVSLINLLRRRILLSPWLLGRCTRLILEVVAQADPDAELYEIGGMPSVHCPDMLIFNASTYPRLRDDQLQPATVNPVDVGPLFSVERIEA